MMLSFRVVVAVLALALPLVFSATPSTFSWADCGVQLSKAIHYQSASVSPLIAEQNQRLSVNVKATITDLIYDAETRLMVWKDGELFMDVYIDSLCSIITNTKALSCPLYPGASSFTYEFDSVPALPSGQYVINIKSELAAFGSSPNTEIGCIAFTGTVDSLESNSCTYTSNFNVRVRGDANYTTNDIQKRKVGDLIQIGPIVGSGGDQAYGEFATDFVGSEDVGGTVSTKGYNWALNGTLMSRFVDAQYEGHVLDVYYGTFYVLYNNIVNFAGKFNWTVDTDPRRTTGAEQVSGQMWFDPEYYVLDQFAWPITLANLGPFTVKTVGDGTFLVEGSHDFCTCGFDACGRCGGDGGGCGFGRPDDNSDDWGVRKRAAVACGVVAFLLIALVVELSRRVRRARRRIPINDEDLMDHPEKPDYGTMAIDDAIREGERVV